MSNVNPGGKNPYTPVWPVFLGIAALFVLALTAYLAIAHMPDEDVDTLKATDIEERAAGVIHFLAKQSAVTGTNITGDALNALPAQIDSLQLLEPALDHVRVSQDGITVFEHCLSDFTDSHWIGTTTATVSTNNSERACAVVSFASEEIVHDGSTVSIEIGIRTDRDKNCAVEAYEALKLKMMRLGLGIILLCAFSTTAFVLWRTLDDRRKLVRHRQEEHILFSGMLANSIVHDFRNPMSSVKLDAQMLLRECRREGGGDQERLGVLAARICKTLGRMDDIFSEFLFLAKPATPNAEKFDLRTCIDSCIEMFTARLEQRKLKCRFDAPLGDLTAFATESAVRRAVMNVITNAIQHSPEGGEIQVAVEECGDFWQTDVRDEGKGIPPNLREKVFEMFYTTRTSGTGLGLFMARAALTNCGGSITALGRDGGGCVMRMRIPRQTHRDESVHKSDNALA